MSADTKTFEVPQGFLRKKFVAPVPPKGYVREEEITARVLDLDGWRTCLVSAAVGYGKTALLSQWYGDLSARSDAVCLWMTLDGHDRDPVRFLKSLALELQQVDGVFYEYYEEMLTAADDLEALLVGLVRLMDTALDSEHVHVLMFDDYEKASGTGVDRVLFFLHRYCGENVRLLVAGNYLSAEMEDLQLDPDVMEFTTDDIALVGERLRAFAFSVIPDLGEREFEEIRGKCEGWPMSFMFQRLARRRLGPGGDIESLLAGYHNRFFEKSVFSALEPKVCEFLIETSFLEDLGPDVCAYVTESMQAPEMLRWLAAHNVFVTYDVACSAYRCHPIFRKFLLDKFLALSPAQIAGLARRACRWYVDAGEQAPALKYLALASDPQFLIGSITGQTGLTVPGHYESMTAYLVDTPSEEFLSRLFPLWVAAWSSISAGRVDFARFAIGRARELDARASSSSIYDYADAICLALDGKTAESLATIESLLADEGLPSAFRCLLVHMEGEDHERLGDIKGSQALYQRAYSLAQREETPFYRLFDLYLLSRQLLDLGRVDEAAGYAQIALRECNEDGSLYAEFNTVIAYTCILRNDLGEAEERLLRARRRVTPESNVDMYVDKQVCYARLLQARGKLAAAIEETENVLRAIRGKTIPRNLDVEAHATLVGLAVRAGDLALAQSSEWRLDEFKGNPDVLRALPCMQSKAELELLRGNAEQARALMEQMREKASEVGSSRTLAEVAVFMASLEKREGNAVQAAVELGKAIELALANDNVNVFLKADPSVRDLLLEVATSRKTSGKIRGFAKRVLAVFGEETDVEDEIARAEGDVAGYYALTEREREVLKSLNAGMSRSEIARSLSISENTVKSHLKNVYAKLGVHNRAEAYKASPDAAE